MLGWHVNLYPKPHGLAMSKEGYALRHNIPHEKLVGTWEAGLDGVEWMQGLVTAGQAVLLASNGGYPMTYEVDRTSLIQAISPAPPGMRSWSEMRWLRSPKMLTDRVIVDFWDQS